MNRTTITKSLGFADVTTLANGDTVIDNLAGRETASSLVIARSTTDGSLVVAVSQHKGASIWREDGGEVSRMHDLAPAALVQGF